MIDNKARRLKIIEPGLEAYTGPIGGYDFVDGISEHAVGWQEANRIGAAMRVEDADEEGYQISPAVHMFRIRDLPADSAEVLADGKNIEIDGETVPISQRFTRDELENIADKKGLPGLREIAARWEVGARSINDLIDRIVESQAREDAKANKGKML